MADPFYIRPFFIGGGQSFHPILGFQYFAVEIVQGAPHDFSDGGTVIYRAYFICH